MLSQDRELFGNASAGPACARQEEGVQSPGQGSRSRAAPVRDGGDLLSSAVQALSRAFLLLERPEVPCDAACGCTAL